MYRAATLVTVGTMLIATSFGCTKSPSQTRAAVTDMLIMSGVAVDGNGSPVSGATVTIERDPMVLTTSDDAGNFSLSLTRTQVAAIGNSMDERRLSFVVYIQKKSLNLYSATTPISLSDIGLKNLGTITISAAGGYSGKVLLAHAGQIKGAAGDSQVYIGPVKATVTTDGSFLADSVPSGKVPLSVAAPAMHAFYDQVEILSGSMQNRADPIILFSGTGPDGIVIEKANRSLSDLVKGGHPTSKRFAAHPADQTVYVRFSADLSKLEALGSQERNLAAGRILSGANLVAPGSASSSTLPRGNTSTAAANATTPGVSQTDIPWYPVAQDFDFDFPEAGGQTLYYQFSSGTKTKFSAIYQTGVNVDPFADSNGFIIDDGSGYSPTSRVKISVTVPAAAVSMRFASDEKTIASALWRPISANAVYDFLPKDTDPGTGNTALARELFGQFQDAYGHTSGLFHATTNLNLFSGLGFRLGDGSGFWSSQLAPLSISLPAGATKMRIGESLDVIKDRLWQTASQQTQYLFVPQLDTVNSFYFVAGNREVCLQVEDDNAFISQAICRKVNIDLFSMPNPGFKINGGDSATTSRIVTLQINVPKDALEMRIFENAPQGGSIGNGTVSIINVGGSISTIAERTWLVASNVATYTFSSNGSKALRVQFRTKGGLVSSTYEQNITLIPFIESFGMTSFTINGAPFNSAPVVIDPVLQVAVFNVPESAVWAGLAVASNLRDAIATTQGDSILNSNSGAITTVWQDVRSPLMLQLKTSGTKTIQLQFRNANGDLSPVFQQTVYFEPFPAQLVALNLGNAVVTANSGQNIAQVDVNLVAPPSPIAKMMRFTAVLNGGSTPPTFGEYSLPYSTYSVLSFPVTGAGAVQYTIWAQLKDLNGNESGVYSQTITLTIPELATTNGSGT